MIRVLRVEMFFASTIEEINKKVNIFLEEINLCPGNYIDIKLFKLGDVYQAILVYAEVISLRKVPKITEDNDIINMELTDIQELQVKILTGMMVWEEPDGKGGLYHNINPFYKADLEDIMENIDKARKIYPDLFQSFVSNWCLSHAEKLGIYERGDGYSNLLAELVKAAIKSHDIPPILDYDELLELKL